VQLYAILIAEDKEYRVSPGQKVKVDRLQAEPGDTIEFDRISRLVKGDRVVDGEPAVAGARVRARVVKHGQDKGVIVFKMNRRQLYHKRHERERQFTVLAIDEIVFGDDVFDKRDLDPRKIRKAEAAARAKEAKAQRSAQGKKRVAAENVKSPTANVTVPAAPEKPAPVSPPRRQVAAEAVRPSGAQATPHGNAAGKQQAGLRKWLGLAVVLALLLVLAIFFWSRIPTTIEVAGSKDGTALTSEQIRLLKTRAAQHLHSPAQPPD
jgi:large subunit ribosomal protein L21